MPQAFSSDVVAATFESYPPEVRLAMMALRALIFEVAASTPGVLPLEECLKWGEPAYLTTRSRTGTTIRLGWKKSRPDRCSMLFNCRTTLVETFRTLFPTGLHFEGNREIALQVGQAIPRAELAFCIEAALTYHRKA